MANIFEKGYKKYIGDPATKIGRQITDAGDEFVEGIEEGIGMGEDFVKEEGIFEPGGFISDMTGGTMTPTGILTGGAVQSEKQQQYQFEKGEAKIAKDIRQEGALDAASLADINLKKSLLGKQERAEATGKVSQRGLRKGRKSLLSGGEEGLGSGAFGLGDTGALGGK